MPSLWCDPKKIRNSNIGTRNKYKFQNHKIFPSTLTEEGGVRRSSSPSPSSPEAVKKLLQVKRAGGDIEKVLERYLFGLPTYNEKLQ